MQALWAWCGGPPSRGRRLSRDLASRVPCLPQPGSLEAREFVAGTWLGRAAGAASWPRQHSRFPRPRRRTLFAVPPAARLPDSPQPCWPLYRRGSAHRRCEGSWEQQEACAAAYHAAPAAAAAAGAATAARAALTTPRRRPLAGWPRPSCTRGPWTPAGQWRCGAGALTRRRAGAAHSRRRAAAAAAAPEHHHRRLHLLTRPHATNRPRASVVVSWSLMYSCSHCTTSSCCLHPASCVSSSSCARAGWERAVVGA